MPTATKTDATRIRSGASKRAVPKHDEVYGQQLLQQAEVALVGHDDIPAGVDPATGEIADGVSSESVTQTNVQAPSPSGASVHTLASSYQMAPLRPAGYLGNREEIQAELDAMAFAVRSFPLKQPDQIMREVAAYSARLTELTVLLHRSEDYDRQYARVRTMQVQKWLDELDRQFKIASRLVEVQRQDIELMR